MIQTKIREIQFHFADVIGTKIERYETAELLQSDGKWDDWPDLPIRLYTESGKLISVSWSEFDDLSVAAEQSLPTWAEGSTIRWVENSIEKINPAIRP